MDRYTINGSISNQYQITIYKWLVDIDYNKAVELFRKAADKDCMIAISNLAMMYVNGPDAAKKLEKAAKLYQMAIKKGNVIAANNLAYMYLHGIGFTKNISLAIKLYKYAIGRGCATATDNLARIYFYGINVEINYH